MNLPNPEPGPESWAPGVLLSHYVSLKLYGTLREFSIKLLCYLSVTERFTMGVCKCTKTLSEERGWL